MTRLGTKLVAMAALIMMAPSLAGAASGTDKNITLMDAVAKGMITNPEFGIVANDRRATDEELRQAKGLYLPSIDLNADGGFERTDTPSIDDTSFWLRSRASLTLTQMLFDGFAAKSEVQRQKARVKSTSFRVDETAEFVGLDITEGFLEVLRQRDLLAISQANVQDHARITQLVQDGAYAGTITEGDVAQVEARMSQAKATESSIRQDLREAESLFIRETGEMPDSLVFPEIPHDKMPASVEEAIRQALTKGPTIGVREADIEVAKAEYKAAGSTLYPQIDFVANGSTGEDLQGVIGNENRASALAVLNWNLYRGGADRARQREFMYRHAIAKETRADAARQIEKEMRDTWAGVVAASERAKEYMSQATSNEKVVNIYLDQFSLDRRTLLDVLDSQNELFVSRSNHVNSLYTEIFGVYRILALKGDLLDTLGVNKPREAHHKMPY